MVSKEELSEALQKHPKFAADQVNIEIATIPINDVPRCHFYGEWGVIIFDDTNQVLERYDEDDELVATKKVSDVDTAVNDIIAFDDFGEMEGETLC